jgi:peptidoglycan hydrolase-like protein with peptidoglycan-binding domain
MKAKFATIGLSLALVLGAATPAAAVTVAELQAQINALMAQLASLQGGSSASTGTAITADLTIGSSGAQVSALQSALVSQGYLVMPAGVSMGYFGSLTKAAVMKWQAANGVPATGYFGPISRAKFNTSGVGGTVPGSTVGSGSTTGGSITTPGVEGTITVSLNPTPASAKVYEGDNKKQVLGIKLEAKTSDIKVERVKLKLDENNSSSTNDTDFYRKIASKIYLMDGSSVLASSDLNIDTVVKDGTDYYITLSGFGYVVPRDSTRVLYVAVDAMSNWDSAFDGDAWTITVPVDGVRGVDGAGVNQYGPSSSFGRDFTTEGELSESATLTASNNVNTPKAAEVIAAQGTGENEYDNLPLLKADFRAEKDDVTLTDLVVSITRGGNTSSATATTAYLMDGSTVLGSATVVGTSATAMTATFSDIDVDISKDSTKTLTFSVDIDSAGTSGTTFSASFSSGNMTAENSQGSGITESGSATGETITVRSVGLEISLVSKSITKSSTQSQGNTSTSTAEANFVIRVKAVGGDITIGNSASDTPFVTNAGTATADDDASFIIYKSGAAYATGGASTSSITVPSGVVTSGLTNGFKVQEGNTVDIPVSFLFEARTTAGASVPTASYAVGLAQLNWWNGATANTSDFMAGNADWRTSTVALP